MNESPSELYEQYRSWILTHRAAYYTVEETADEGRTILFITDYATAAVSFIFLDWEIVELRITDKEDETRFYLHFELKQLEHAQELFNEMMTCLLELRERTQTKILLSCSCALTTSFFADKLNEAAAALELDYEFSAVSYDRLFEKGFDSDVILLAPQIGYLYREAQKILSGRQVILIPAALFGTYDVPGVISLVRDKLAEGRKKKKEPVSSLPLVEQSGVRLVICLISEYGGIRMIYRVFDGCRERYDNVILKNDFKLSDIGDICDVALATNPDIQSICVVTPGSINKGRMTFHHADIIDVDVAKMFTRRCQRPVVFINDANAMAVGFHASTGKYHNLIFYFHPHASRTCGTGIIVNNSLMPGAHALAGEMRYLKDAFAYSGDPEQLVWTPQGALEVMADYLSVLIASIDPEAVVINCDMVPDPDDLRKKLSGIFPKNALPDLVKVDDVTEYMFAGGLVLANQNVSQ